MYDTYRAYLDHVEEESLQREGVSGEAQQKALDVFEKVSIIAWEETEEYNPVRHGDVTYTKRDNLSYVKYRYPLCWALDISP